MGIKTLTIADLEEQGPRGPVWILNSVATSKLDTSAEIVMAIPGLHGRDADALVIKETWLPQDAAAMFGRERLLQSSQFRTAVASGVLTIITPEAAKEIQARPGAREEQARLDDTERHVRKAGAARTIAQSNVDMYIADEHGRPVKDDDDDDSNDLKVDMYGPDEVDNVAKLAKAGVEETDDGFKPSFIMFVDKIRNGTDMAALNAIRTRGKFSRKELRHLRDNLHKHPETVRAIKEKLVELKRKKKPLLV
jgi:hypothetical protein